MYECGKTVQVAGEMRRYGLDFLGLCETRWLKSGEVSLATGEHLIYSGHEEDGAPHTYGVGIMLSKLAKKALIDWNPLGPRLMTARFHTKRKDINLQIIQGYAPTESDSTMDEKESFHRMLHQALSKVNRKDVLLLMGDFNAQIGSSNVGYEEVMGRHGLGQMNVNGELLANTCATQELVIGGSIFPHKSIHKATWLHPNNITENQIDHICICKRFRSSLQDVRTYRGADVASDHHLLVGKIKLKFRKRPVNSSPRLKFNVEHLKDPLKKEEFNITLKNRFDALGQLDEEQDINSTWINIRDCYTKTCQEVLGKREKRHKPWISKRTLEQIETRREKKERWCSSRTRAAKIESRELYSQARKEVKNSIKEDKRKYVEDLAQEAEEAAGSGNMAGLYQTTRKLTGSFRNIDMPIRDKEGYLLTDDERKRQRWGEHFRELLNRPRPDNPPDIPPALTDLDISIEKPSLVEIENAIRTMKNGKAAGPDAIPPEALKSDVELNAKVLSQLFGKIWDEEELPEDFMEGHLIKLPKKGNLQECKNYRGIMLLSIPGKVLSRVILNRIKEAVDPLLREEQAGFRQGRSCTDQIAILRTIVEQSIEWNASLYVNFIDFEKAFDSLDRETIWKLMRHYGIPEEIVLLVKRSYDGMKCRVVAGGQLSDPFEVTTGVRQGCLLSPFLFLLAVDWIMRQTADQGNGIQWTFTEKLDDLDFADDLALLSHSHSQMQRKTETLDRISARTGLKIHAGKTKVLRIKAATDAPITLHDEPLEDVQSFTYLGSVLNVEGGNDEDIKIRIQKARAAFVMLRKIWNAKEIKTCTKLRIFRSNVKSVLLYGAETWHLTKQKSSKIQSFINQCLRQILKIKWYDFITTEEVLERAGEEKIENVIKKRRWRWIGHTLRKPVGCIARRSLQWNPQGQRNRGRPKETLRREIERDLRAMGKNWREIESVARDRQEWRLLVDGLCPNGG